MRKRFYWIRSIFRHFNYDLILVNLKYPNPIRLENFDARFRELFDNVKDTTAISEVPMSVLYQFALRVSKSSNLPIAEVGTFRGGSAYLIAKTCPNTTVHVFDTFNGMPETGMHDNHKKGDFAVNSNDVIKYLQQLKNIRIHEGIFPATSAPVQDQQFSLVHIDVDIYQSVKNCLEFFYPRTAPGGIIISDDYGTLSCPGAKKAWDEFFADKREQSIYLSTRQCFIIKEVV